jgi:hypothetical protein
MTHGRSARTALNSRTKNRRATLTGFSVEPTNRPPAPSASLEARVAELEKEVAALRDVVNRLDGAVPNYFDTGVNEGNKKPGPTKNIQDDELFRSRDGIVSWLEEVWPELIHPLLAAANPRQVATVLKKVARPKNIQPPWQSRFLAHPAKLFDFLRSSKFKKRPPKKTVMDAVNRPAEDEKRKRAANRLPTRQIANAMAGVPKLRWRTSLDRCSTNPCSYPVAISTDRYYRAMFPVPVPSQPNKSSVRIS